MSNESLFNEYGYPKVYRSVADVSGVFVESVLETACAAELEKSVAEDLEVEDPKDG